MNVYRTIDDRGLSAEKRRLDAQAVAVWVRERALLGAHLLTRPGGRLLDLGCGTGATTRAIADAWPGWEVVGLDTDARMVADGPGVGRLRFAHVAPGAPLPLADASVDAVYGRFLMQHVPHPAELLAEVRRVLRPGGRVLLTDVDDRAVVFEPEPAALREIYRRAASLDPEDQEWQGKIQAFGP